MSRRSRETTGPNVDIPTTTESNQGDPPHDSSDSGTIDASTGGTHALSGRANRRLRRSSPAGASDERGPATVQAQYSGQPWLRHRCAAGAALPGTARTV